MKLLVDSLQPGAFDVRIDLGGLDTGVAEHFLNQSQVGSSGQQMCCKTVTQAVGADVGVDAGTPGVQLDQSPELNAIKGTSIS